MILLSVGTQFPFDRLVRAVDSWATAVGRHDVVAQIGPSDFKPAMLKCFGLVSPSEFRELQAEADIMIAHAGMGSILTAMEFSKPIIIMPRDHTLGEHRNGHQMATANRFGNVPGIVVVNNTESLLSRLDNLDDLMAAQSGPKTERDQFAKNLKSFINGDLQA